MRIKSVLRALRLGCKRRSHAEMSKSCAHLGLLKNPAHLAKDFYTDDRQEQGVSAASLCGPKNANHTTILLAGEADDEPRREFSELQRLFCGVQKRSTDEIYESLHMYGGSYPFQIFQKVISCEYPTTPSWVLHLHAA